MKAYLINMHLLVPSSGSSTKVKVKYKGYIFQKMAVSGAFVFHKHILFFPLSAVKRPSDSNHEESVKVKEQAILELGGLLAETKQAEGID